MLRRVLVLALQRRYAAASAQRAAAASAARAALGTILRYSAGLLDLLDLATCSTTRISMHEYLGTTAVV